MKLASMDKRTQLTAVISLTVLALAGVWFGLISPQQQHLRQLADRQQKAQTKLQQVNTTLKQAKQVEADLAEKLVELQKVEAGMAAGDLYSWLITTVRDFKNDYRVDIPQFSQIDGPRDVTMLPSFPYKQISVTIGGTGRYFEIGKFLSDLENQFPYVRLANLTLEPVSAAPGVEGDKLSFKVDVVALVKPVNSLLAKKQ